MIIGLQHPITIEVQATITVKPASVEVAPDPVDPAPDPVDPPADPDPVDPDPVDPDPVTPPEGGLALEYIGACRIRQGTFGDSRASYSPGAIGVSDDGIWVAGHAHHSAVGKFALPLEWASTFDVAGMPIVDNTVPFAAINPEPWQGGSALTITEIFEEQGRVVVNGVEFYDTTGNTQDMTVIQDGVQSGFYQIEGGAKAAGWIQKVPSEWVSQIGEYLMGYAANVAINGRLSHGPSLYGWDGQAQTLIPTVEHMVFPLDHRMGSSDWGGALADPLWNEISEAHTAFIFGDDYIAVGNTGGLQTGIGYKNEQLQDDGSYITLGGPGAYAASDYYNYFWRFRLSDILSAENPWDVRPYAYGVIDAPFRIRGAAFLDGYLYLADSKADRVQNPYESQPVIYKYRVIQ